MKNLAKLFLISGLLFSCEESIRDTQTETISAEAFSQSMTMNNIVFAEGYGIITNNANLSGWTSVWPNDSIWDSIFIVNASSANRIEVYYDSAIDAKGNLLNGKLVIESYLNLFAPGSSVIFDVADFSINGVDLGGVHELTKSSLGNDFNVTYSGDNLIYRNHEIAYEDLINSNLNYSGEVLFDSVNRTFNWSYQPSSGSGINSRGASYDFTVLNSIASGDACAYLMNGNVSVKPSEFTTRLVEYELDCSNSFRVRVDSNWIDVAI